MRQKSGCKSVTNDKKMINKSLVVENEKPYNRPKILDNLQNLKIFSTFAAGI